MWCLFDSSTERPVSLGLGYWWVLVFFGSLHRYLFIEAVLYSLQDPSSPIARVHLGLILSHLSCYLGKMSQPLGWWIALRLLHKENARYCPACLLCCLSSSFGSKCDLFWSLWDKCLDELRHKQEEALLSIFKVCTFWLRYPLPIPQPLPLATTNLSSVRFFFSFRFHIQMKS